MGRHREFDVDQALDAVVCMFWRKGYEGVSYTDLTQATGVERPALYSAFGNKESLFRLALSRYYERYLDFFPKALELPTSREVVSHILYQAAELHTRYPEHKGCLGINGALACSDESEPIRCALISERAKGEASLLHRLERAKEEGDLPMSANCAALTRLVTAVLHGMAVQAKSGYSYDSLISIVEQVLNTWPSNN